MKKLVLLKQEMIKQDVTSLKLSQAIGINPSILSLYLNGWREMPDEIKQQIGNYLKVEPRKLFSSYQGDTSSCSPSAAPSAADQGATAR